MRTDKLLRLSTIALLLVFPGAPQPKEVLKMTPRELKALSKEQLASTPAIDAFTVSIADGS